MRTKPAYPNTRTRSPPRRRFRDRETREIRQPNHGRSCRPVRRRPEPDLSGPPLALNRYHHCEYECARKQLSEFNELFPRRQLTSEKYGWANLTPDEPEKSHSGLSPENVAPKTHPLRLVEPNNDINSRDNGSVHEIEVFQDNELSYYKPEKTFQSKGKGCVTTYSSLISSKDYFNEIYRDVGFSRGKDLVPDDGYGLRSNEGLDSIDMAGVPDDSRPKIFMRGSIVDSIVDKIEVDDAYNSLREDMRDGWMLDHNHASDQYQDGEYSGLRSSNVSRGSQDMEIVGEYSGSRGFLVEHGLGVKWDDGSVQEGEDFGFERDGGLRSYEEVLKRLPNSEYDEVFYENKDGPQQMGEAEELGIQDLSRNRMSFDDVYDLSNVDGQCTAEDLAGLSVLKDYGFRETPDEETDHDMLSSSFLMQEYSNQLVKPSIKKRLGHSSRPFIKPYSQISKRRPGPPSFSSDKNREQNKLSRTNMDDFKDGVLGDDLLDINMKWSRMEPVEDSERFEQLVQKAFLKFVKALYENPAQQSKFTKQGSTRPLKCSVCCSNSKEFVDTLSLLQHAFMCRAAGLRVEHLGFHRALCVLIGWSYEATPNGFWVRQTLSNAEALAVKEDLIIWPPVVFVHNSFIANTNPDGQMLVSIEKIKTIIKGMGFGRGMTKVCHGKAASQSTMVVNFHGTLSGFQEAEKLHKHYAENKHGRSEFQRISSRSNCTSDGSRNTDNKKIKSCFYGYLGMAEDLDKLDSMTKKRCVVKSKKEIQAIAGKELMIVSK